jgi:hypothetical protein
MGISFLSGVGRHYGMDVDNGVRVKDQMLVVLVAFIVGIEQ